MGNMTWSYIKLNLMMIWDTTAIWYALAGGLLIGFAVSVLFIFNGKIAGISGILGQALSLSFRGQGWRYAFLIGLVISPFVYGFFHTLPDVSIASSNSITIIAGLLVGIGTRMGNGCTSGHGVCGIARFSMRSIVATITFMATGIVTVFIIRHLI